MDKKTEILVLGSFQNILGALWINKVIHKLEIVSKFRF